MFARVFSFYLFSFIIEVIMLIALFSCDSGDIDILSFASSKYKMLSIFHWLEAALCTYWRRIGRDRYI